MLENEAELNKRYFPLDFKDTDRSLLVKHPETGIPIQIGKISSDLKTIEYFGSPEEIENRIEQFTQYLTDIYLINVKGESVKLFKYQEGYVLLPDLTTMSQEIYVDMEEEKTHIGYIFLDGSVLLKGKKTEKYVKHLAEDVEVFYGQYLHHN